jgi:Inosine-uridine preferring nucleoside hydrolase/Secretion system C-terminal sorting domain/Bacterial Ig-like domain (group 2)
MEATKAMTRIASGFRLLLVMALIHFSLCSKAQTFQLLENIVFDSRPADFLADFDITPSHDNLESSIQLNTNGEESDSPVASLIKFGSNGSIWAQDGQDLFSSAYRYEAGETYKMKLELAVGGDFPYSYNAYIRKAEETEAPVRVIYDTDMCLDVDDVGGLAVLHALADMGEAKILAVVFNEVHADGAAAIDAINTWYGRGHIPVGIYKGILNNPDYSSYLNYLSGFPNDIPDDPRMIPSAVEVYKESLELQPDGSVTIVSVGFLNNLSELLDAYPELVAAKVKELVIMAGVQNDGFNLVRHDLSDASKNVFTNWPTPIVVSQPGGNIYTGSPLEHTPAENPVREAYYRWFGNFGDRSSWDLISVLYAVRGEQYFKLMSDGTGSFSNYTYDMEEGKRSYIMAKLSVSAYEELLNDLICRTPLMLHLYEPWTQIAAEYDWVNHGTPISNLRIENQLDTAGLSVENLLISDYRFVEGVAIDCPSFIYRLGASVQLSVNISPPDAINHSVIYAVDNKEVAIIDSISGLLTTTGEGVVTVRARSRDGSGVYGSKNVEVIESDADNVPDPALNLALLESASLSGNGGGRGNPRDILFNPLTADYQLSTDWNEYGVAFQENLGCIEEQDPFYWMVEWERPKLVNYITLGGCYSNQPQDYTMWKIQYLTGSVWEDIDSGQGGWLNDGIFTWGGGLQAPLKTSAIRFIAYSDGTHDLESIHLRARGGVSMQNNDEATIPKASLIQYLEEPFVHVNEEYPEWDEPRIYPNPVKDLLNIELASPAPCFLEITSVRGSTIFRNRVEEDHFRIDMSPYESGIYVISVRMGEQLCTRRICLLK